MMREAAKASGGSLFLTKMMIEDEEFREIRIRELKDEGQYRLAAELEKWGNNADL